MYKIYLEFLNGNKPIEGTTWHSKEKCEQIINDYLSKYSNFEEENGVKFVIKRVDN